MGELMRQYWMPVLYDWELEPDGQPLRVRVLGEDLTAWRDSRGMAGFVSENCPHRGASLFFGRNEENGLRCVYHGWKFDVGGRCVDTPNEPAESNFKDKVRAGAYAAAEFGGIVWVYMGPRQDDPPAVPQFEWGLVPADHRQHSHKLIYECNYMQALEGELDTTHVYFCSPSTGCSRAGGTMERCRCRSTSRSTTSTPCAWASSGIRPNRLTASAAIRAPEYFRTNRASLPTASAR